VINLSESESLKDMKNIIFNFFVLSVLFVSPLYSQHKVIKIWPGLAPGTEGRENNEKTAGGSVINVYQPDLTIFLPEKINKNKPALIVMPGGGYRQVVMKKEGYDIADWLNKNDIAAFVLKYRLKPDEALQDARRALSFLRSKASVYNINPDNIGVIGFSAGGHLAANLSTHFENDRNIDHIESVSCRPDFMVSVYGAVGPFVDDVDKDTPPAFLVHTGDDPKVPVKVSVEYYLALHDNGIPAELHLYESGGHGFALRDVDKPVISWADRCIDWMRVQGILTQ
jgi:acetyl esterase/lipase